MQDDPSELPQPSPTAGGLEGFVQRFGGVSEEFSFYNGEITLRFDKESWTYFLVDPVLGKLIPQNGITSIVKIIDRSTMLVPWSAKMVVEKLLRLIPTETDAQGSIVLKPLSLADFTTIALQAKGAHRDKLEDASNVGKMAHTWLEFYIKAVLANNAEEQQRMLAKKCKDERATNCVDAALGWIAAHNVRYKETERRVYSREYCYAGTLDGLALVDSCGDPACCEQPFKDRLTLIDYKTSNYLHLDYLFQTAAYCKAYMEEHGVVIEDRWVLRLGKELGDFEVWHMTAESYEEDFKGFAACLALSNLVDSVDERMKAQRGRIKGIRKVQKETSKALAKEKAKLAKALEKAEAKRLREEDKARIKAEAKAEREAAKAAKKGTVCTNAGVVPIATLDVPTQGVQEPIVVANLDGSSTSSSATLLSNPEEETCTSTSLSFEEEKPKFRTFDLPMEKK
jgi:hypothetical protein